MIQHAYPSVQRCSASVPLVRPTATPRGVMLSHRNLLHNSGWIERCFEHSRDSRGVIWLPPYRDMGLISGILQPLHLGCKWRALNRSWGGGLTRATVLAVPAPQRQALLETHFRNQLARVLHLDPAQIDPRQPVNTLGLDSLTMLELKNALGESLGVYFPVTRFLWDASISTLASQVLTELSRPASTPISPGMSSLVRQVQQLSHDQVKALLGDKSGVH